MRRLLQNAADFAGNRHCFNRNPSNAFHFQVSGALLLSRGWGEQVIFSRPSLQRTLSHENFFEALTGLLCFDPELMKISRLRRTCPMGKTFNPLAAVFHNVWRRAFSQCLASPVPIYIGAFSRGRTVVSSQCPLRPFIFGDA